MDSNLNQATTKIQASLDHLKSELSAIRAGRATPSLVENVPVNAYGAQMKLVELGTISAPQPSLLTVQVWDAGVVTDVLKAIQSANLGIAPSVEGQVVRLPIPPLTEERRMEYVKLSHQKGEEAKVAIRQVRAEVRNDLEAAKTAGEIGEDELHRQEKLLQDLVDQASAAVEDVVRQKEQELTTL